MKRGDIVGIAMQGDYGKPRPALIIQSDNFQQHGSIVVIPLTGTIIDAPLFRIILEPTAENGLKKISQIMVDKIVSIKKDKVRNVFGAVKRTTLVEVERSMAVFLGLG